MVCSPLQAAALSEAEEGEEEEASPGRLRRRRRTGVAREATEGDEEGAETEPRCMAFRI